MPKKRTENKGTLIGAYVLNLLSRRDYSVAELRRKLRQRGFTTTDSERMIAQLQEKQLLNDESFAQRYVASIVRTRAVGPRWIQAKLQQRGIAPALIEAALQQEFSPEQQQVALKQAMTSWQQRQPGTTGTRDRLARFLLSRGFAASAIQPALSNLS